MKSPHIVYRSMTPSQRELYLQMLRRTRTRYATRGFALGILASTIVAVAGGLLALVW